MEQLQKWLNSIKGRWEELNSAARLIVAVMLMGLFGVFIFNYVWRPPPRMVPLYTNLSQEDAGRIVARLKEMHVPYQLEAEGEAVLVPEPQVHETRLSLASEGLPGGGGVGFEIFDLQRFGESEFSEQIKYHRALEGELSRTISHLNGVERARVHLVLPTQTLFSADQSTASASVVLKLQPGWKMREEQTRGIVHLVAASVRGLDASRVTVVDGEGRQLQGSGESEEEVASGALRYRREYERAQEKTVQQLLDTTLGAGKTLVRVAADLDFSKEERTEERFNPQETAARSFQITEEKDGNSAIGTAGIPGAVSNLPGGATPENTGVTEVGASRRSETRNFEISKVVKRAVEPAGRLNQLQVAVVVDGYWSMVGKKREFKPRSATELARIKTIVESAVGANATRGDKVTVECVPFAAPANTNLSNEPLGPFGKWEPYIPYGAYALGFLLVIVVLFILVRRGPVSSTARAPNLQLPELQASPAQTGANAHMTLPRMPQEGGEDMRVLVADIAAQNPELAARVIRGWLGGSAP